MKKILLMLVVCLGAISMTSCEEDAILIYYMSPDDMSANCIANITLQSRVLESLKDSDGKTEYFTGTESEAIEWFDNKCSDILDSSYIKGAVVSDETWMDMRLIGQTDHNVVKTTRLTFTD